VTSPLVSILISCYGQLSHTQKCLRQLNRSLEQEDIRYEILIIDDHSLDNTASYLRSLEPGIRTFFNQENKGYAKNNNFLANQATGEILCFLNNDVFVKGDWLRPMIEALRTYPNVGMVGNVQQLTRSSAYDHMGVVFSPQGNPGHYGQGFRVNSFKGEVKKWSAVTAACCLIYRQDFLELGGFDETFVNGCEDVDFCLRLSAKGKCSVVAHDSVVEHVKSASEGRKRFNDQNFKILNKRWGESIRGHQSVNDQKLHAVTYFYRGIYKPFSTNLGKWIQSLLILLGVKKIT
jgi:O-antigen biosynthesis protein